MKCGLITPGAKAKALENQVRMRHVVRRWDHQMTKVSIISLAPLFLALACLEKQRFQRMIVVFVNH